MKLLHVALGFHRREAELHCYHHRGSGAKPPLALTWLSSLWVSKVSG